MLLRLAEFFPVDGLDRRNGLFVQIDTALISSVTMCVAVFLGKRNLKKLGESWIRNWVYFRASILHSTVATRFQSSFFRMFKLFWGFFFALVFSNLKVGTANLVSNGFKLERCETKTFRLVNVPVLLFCCSSFCETRSKQEKVNAEVALLQCYKIR